MADPKNIAGTEYARLADRFRRVRAATLMICESLAVDDHQVQSADFVSPPKWHLAHTTWFFETFVLVPHCEGYEPCDASYAYLFNSYYEGLGPRHCRIRRGHLSRPTLDEVGRYREEVDRDVMSLLESEPSPEVYGLVELGLQHEEQHQELLFMDIKHILFSNPTMPAYLTFPRWCREIHPSSPMGWQEFPGGLFPIGSDARHGFCFDNETPRHPAYVAPFALADRLVTNGEYREFMEAGGYEAPRLWHADGWRTREREGWEAPLYWVRDGSGWRQFSFHGLKELHPNEAVCHVSYYEACAYACWRGGRLPTEQEWEVGASRASSVANLFERVGETLDPQGPAPSENAGVNSVRQMFGDVWEWTMSSYSPYPGYRPLPGVLSEYNGKFMVNQMVLRGGASVTPRSHIRAAYRNFYHPHMRWMFAGIRLAEDR